MQKFLATFLFLASSTYCIAQGRYNNKPNDNTNDQVYDRAASPAARVVAPKLPKSYTLFGEKVPLDQVEVHDRFDRELVINTYMQGSTIQIIKQMHRWMPMIEDRLRANGVPDDFKYLCVAESALQNAVSHVGASGFWQFMKATGPSYGLEINDYVDERYNPLKATDAACKYLKDSYAKFNNWTAAAASYNCGVGGYNGNATQQGTQNFYNLLLPEETNRYVFRIMALKYILENPKRSGYFLDDEDVYKPYKATKDYVSNAIPSLIQYAMEHGTNYKTLKLLNPWLRDKSLPGKGKTYEILLPVGK